MTTTLARPLTVVCAVCDRVILDGCTSATDARDHKDTHNTCSHNGHPVARIRPATTNTERAPR